MMTEDTVNSLRDRIKATGDRLLHITNTAVERGQERGEPEIMLAMLAMSAQSSLDTLATWLAAIDTVLSGDETRIQEALDGVHGQLNEASRKLRAQS